MADLTALRSLVSGPVLEPADAGFAEEAGGFNTAVVHTVDLVVGAMNAQDVAHAVSFARDAGMRVRVQATGHGAEAPIVGGMLVTTKRLDSLAVDPAMKVATIGSGARWGAVVAAAADVNLAPITGSSANVGAVGYLTGGGLGPLARSHGFSSDYVRGFTVVTGNGEIVEATPHENADLFWALRGGRRGLGIVTEARVALVELDELYAGSLMFAEEHIETVVRAWVEWTATAPTDVTTSIAVFRFPDLDFMPPPLRGRTLLGLRFAYPGTAGDGEKLAAPLRDAAPVYLDSLGVLAARDVAQIHNDPTNPGPGWASGALLAGIDQDFVTAWLGQVGSGRQVPLLGAEIRHIGSATQTDVEGGSAVGGRQANYTFTLIGAPNPALFAEVVPAAADAVYAAIGPWLSPESTINFVGVARPGQTGEPWSADTHARLAEVRRAHDPHGVFVTA
jgi:FAD/FMN-containing dehydrogenase